MNTARNFDERGLLLLDRIVHVGTMPLADIDPSTAVAFLQCLNNGMVLVRQEYVGGKLVIGCTTFGCETIMRARDDGSVRAAAIVRVKKTRGRR